MAGMFFGAARERGRIRPVHAEVERPPPGERPTILVVGSGFAGFHCVRRLERLLSPEAAEIVLASPIDYLLYAALLPQVAAGVIEPRHLAVALHGTLERTRVVLSHVVTVDVRAQTATLRRPDGSTEQLGWSRLVLAPGSVTRTFNTPGVVEHAKGLKSLAEAVYLRDHMLQELDNADAAGGGGRRRACCTFVVVGGGYSGTELAGQMQLFTRRAVASYPRLRLEDLRWVLVERAPRLLPELNPRLGAGALDVLHGRGVEVHLTTSVEEATADSVRLSDGDTIPTHTLVWCAGVTPSPLIETLGLPTEKGRLRVGADLRVPEAPNVFAFGDAAAVPDLTRPGTLTGQTAQHAQRQGRVAARNVAASLGHGTRRVYRHRNLGFVVDLGGWDAVADPLGIALPRLPALAVTRGYHLLALPASGSRLRIGLDWLLELLTRPQTTQLGFLQDQQTLLAKADHTVASQPTPPAAWATAGADIPSTTTLIGDRGMPRLQTTAGTAPDR
jgi:NADH:ubiquinone reductase (H+-translocating)